MTDRQLQNSYLVTGLKSLQAYNVVMILTGNEPSDERVASTKRVAGPRRTRPRFCRTGLVAVALIGIGVLAAACGGASFSPGVASLGKTTTTTGSSAAPSGSSDSALAYTNCMRTHGEPNLPDVSIEGGSVHISASAGSGVDPSSPQFAAASNACKQLLPKSGSSEANTITPADQADYLKAVACMRSHGFPDFPDPVFQNNSVTFNAHGSDIDTHSSQYKSALATCEKLIPSGLPYSPTGS
jgi:hypothetical protein